MSWQRCLYSTLWYLLAPFAVLRLFWRARKQPEYKQHIAERFGFYKQTSARPLFWLHAVSVGETRAAQPLVTELLKRYPTHNILLTHMTPTGRATGEALFKNEFKDERVLRCYLPYDLPCAVRRFLKHFHPHTGLLLETELWPNLIAICKQHNVPLYLVNARLSEKSLRGYQRAGKLATESVQALAGVVAQTQADARRLTQLGAREVQIAGNLKFDIAIEPALIARGQQWRKQWQSMKNRPVLLWVSTREGEEAVLLEAWRKVQMPEVLLVVVPRHPQRFDDVAALLTNAGFKVQRRSAGFDNATDYDVVLGDSMGEMPAYYAASDVALIGGSFLPFGGQNLIEACTLGCPAIIGPHTYNFSEVVKNATAAGAALQVAAAEPALAAVRDLLNDAHRRKRMGSAGLQFVQMHQGAIVRTLDALKLS